MKYIDLYNFEYVPEDIRQIIATECSAWDTAYGYTNKNYSANQAFQLQLLANASFAEAQTLQLVNDVVSKNEINNLLASKGISIHLSDTYFLNDKYPGEIYSGFKRLSDMTYCDLVRIGGSYDTNSIWTVEVKATKSTSLLKPSTFHHADLVLVYYLDLGEIHVLATSVFPRKSRTDSDYIDLGVLSQPINFKPITVSKDWKISY